MNPKTPTKKRTDGVRLSPIPNKFLNSICIWNGVRRVKADVADRIILYVKKHPELLKEILNS